MNDISKQGLFDRALEMANKLQNEILFEGKEFVDCLYGFLTIAELLQRNDDIKWVKFEFEGGKNTIKYRKCTVKILQNNNVVKMKNHEFFLEMHLIASYHALKSLVDGTKKEYVEFNVKYKDIKQFQEKTNEHLNNEQVVIIVNKLEIKEILIKTKKEMVSRLNKIIHEISYGKKPNEIFVNFQKLVNQKISDSNPKLIEELVEKIENLGQIENPEKASHVAFACRRLIKAIADNLYPAKNEMYVMKGGRELKVGDGNYLNRLTAFIDSCNSENKKFLFKKIEFLKDLYGEMPESINEGIHQNISNRGAEMIVIYSYLFLGEIILEKTESQIQST